jgi:hypothetical protein
MKRILFWKRVYLLPAAFAKVGGVVLLAANVMMLISSGCMSQQAQAIYEARMAETRTHYASWNIIDANELEEFTIGCPPQKLYTQQFEITYQIVAFRTVPRRQVLYVLRSQKRVAYQYSEESTELNVLDVNSGKWLWHSWVPVGGRYVDSAIAPDGNSMALITEQNTKNGLGVHLSVLNLEIEDWQVTSDVKRTGLGLCNVIVLLDPLRHSCLRFSPDGKYLAVLGMNPDYKPFHSDSWAIHIYTLPFSDYDNDAKKPITIPIDKASLGGLWYESDPDTPSHLHVLRPDWSKTYYGVFDTETGKEIEGMHLREDLRNFGDVCVVGNRILVIHGGDLTTFKPGNLTEVDTQCPLVCQGDVLSKTERFVAIGAFFSYMDKDRSYILSIFDARNLNKPPSEVRILGLSSPKEDYSPPLPPPPTAIVGDYLLVLRVRYIGSFWKGTQCDACTILRYDLRKIPSLWVQNEETQ